MNISSSCTAQQLRQWSSFVSQLEVFVEHFIDVSDTSRPPLQIGFKVGETVEPSYYQRGWPEWREQHFQIFMDKFWYAFHAVQDQLSFLKGKMRKDLSDIWQRLVKLRDKMTELWGKDDDTEDDAPSEAVQSIAVELEDLDAPEVCFQLDARGLLH